MIATVTLGALAAVLVVGLLVLTRRPAGAQSVVRWSGLAITALTAAALTPLTVQDSGAAASYLLGVPVLAAMLPLLAQRFGRVAGIADLVAAVVIGVWALLLALGIGTAFLPVVLLYLASALRGLAARPSPSS